MFERFTERARQVVVLAQDEARALGHTYVGTEHLVLGLLREEEGLAARVLDELGVDVETARRRTRDAFPPGSEPTVGQLPLTPRTRKVLELALREALMLGHNYIGTEHVLLGLMREPNGFGYRLLADLNADDETVRSAVIAKLSGPRKPRAWEPVRAQRVSPNPQPEDSIHVYVRSNKPLVLSLEDATALLDALADALGRSVDTDQDETA